MTSYTLTLKESRVKFNFEFNTKCFFICFLKEGSSVFILF
ncbi:hypothetical protein FM106_24155 [Brachybacterium faecium]|nr:hypothetical protein FM106_24155 [Brachybacterium faecium]